MGRRSTKENKNMYQQAREAAELTREQASERMRFVSEDRIEKIESGRSEPHPEEVAAMAEAYRTPLLRNRFCSGECPLGRERVREIPEKDLPGIVIGLLADLNALNGQRERLIEIASDGEIHEDERADFEKIAERLSSVTVSAGALQLWMEKQILLGRM